MPIFRVKSVKIYTGQKKFTRAPPVAPVTNMRYDLRLPLKMTCQLFWTFLDLCSRTLSIINHNPLNNKPSNNGRPPTTGRACILGSPKSGCDGSLHAEKVASFQFPNEWLRIVGGRQALPPGKITPTLHSAAKSSSAEAGLRPAKGGRPLCSQRALGLLTDSLVCTACNQS